MGGGSDIPVAGSPRLLVVVLVCGHSEEITMGFAAGSWGRGLLHVRLRLAVQPCAFGTFGAANLRSEGFRGGVAEVVLISFSCAQRRKRLEYSFDPAVWRPLPHLLLLGPRVFWWDLGG